MSILESGSFGQFLSTRSISVGPCSSQKVALWARGNLVPCLSPEVFRVNKEGIDRNLTGFVLFYRFDSIWVIVLKGKCLCIKYSNVLAILSYF